MAFTKQTQSNDYETVSPKEEKIIEDHTRKAGKQRVSSMTESQRLEFLKALEQAR